LLKARVHHREGEELPYGMQWRSSCARQKLLSEKGSAHKYFFDDGDLYRNKNSFL